MCMLVMELGIGIIIITIIVMCCFVLFLFCFFGIGGGVLFLSIVSFLCVVFLEFIKCVYGLRWIYCGGGVACYVECTNMVKKW